MSHTRRRWTPAEDALLRALYAAGTPAKAAARQLGRTRAAVWRRLYDLGVATGRKRPLDPAFLGRVREAHAAGWHDARIARALGCHAETVRRCRARLGVPANPSPGGGWRLGREAS